MKSTQKQVKTRAKVTKVRDVRIHAYLWHTSMCLLEGGQEQPKSAVSQYKASLVFTAFSLEAYLNWLGKRLFPHWQYLERLSPQGKVTLISHHLELKIDLGSRPWQLIKDLFAFRNEIAHGKSTTLDRSTEETINEDLDAKVGDFIKTTSERF